MATVTIEFGHALDMTQWDFSGYEQSTISNAQSTSFTATSPDGSTFMFFGSQFQYGTDGFPTDGTITAMDIHFQSGQWVQISNTSLSVSDFNALMADHDNQAFEAALFSGADTFAGTGEADHIFGYDGNDTIITGGGADIIDAGRGDDVVELSANTILVKGAIVGGAGIDTLEVDGDTHVRYVHFGARGTGFEQYRANGALIGTHANNVFDFSGFTFAQGDGAYAGAIADGMGGDDRLIGINGAGNKLGGGNGRDLVVGGDHIDFLSGGNGNDTIKGGGGDDHISGDAGNDRIYGGDGNDVIDEASGTPGGLGNDFVSGGKGDDWIFGGTGRSTLMGGAGNDILEGGDGNEKFFGGAGDDQINLGLGTDHASGGRGNDLFYGISFNSAESIDGGPGKDTLILYDDYSAGLKLGPKMLLNVEVIEILGTTAQKIITSDATVAAGATLTIDAQSDTANGALTFDGAAETDGRFVVLGTQRDDIITTGAGDDKIYAGTGADVIHAGMGNDSIYFLYNNNYTLGSEDKVDGGPGDDTLYVSGPYDQSPLVFGAHTIANIEKIVVEPGDFFGTPFGYEFTFDNANVAAGATLEIDARQLASGAAVTMDASAETDGSFVFLGGAAKETFIGGQFGNIFLGGDGADHLVGGAGTDTFIYHAVSESTGPGYDTIQDFDGAKDILALTFQVRALNPEISGGTLSASQFDADLEAAVGGGQLGRHHAVLFAPDSGDLAGDLFLVIDRNGIAGYQAGQDFVVALDHAANLNNLGNDFHVT